MKITTEESKATVRRVAHLADGPVARANGYRRDYQVDTVVIEYTWKDGRFDVDSTFDIRLAGPWTKKDGSPAKDRASDMRPTTVDWSSRLDLTPDHAWLTPVIELLRPAPDLSMAILLDHEREI